MAAARSVVPCCGSPSPAYPDLLPVCAGRFPARMYAVAGDRDHPLPGRSFGGRGGRHLLTRQDVTSYQGGVMANIRPAVGAVNSVLVLRTSVWSILKWAVRLAEAREANGTGAHSPAVSPSRPRATLLGDRDTIRGSGMPQPTTSQSNQFSARPYTLPRFREMTAADLPGLMTVPDPPRPTPKSSLDSCGLDPPMGSRRPVRDQHGQPTRGSWHPVPTSRPPSSTTGTPQHRTHPISASKNPPNRRRPNPTP